VKIYYFILSVLVLCFRFSIVNTSLFCIIFYSIKVQWKITRLYLSKSKKRKTMSGSCPCCYERKR